MTWRLCVCSVSRLIKPGVRWKVVSLILDGKELDEFSNGNTDIRTGERQIKSGRREETVCCALLVWLVC